MRTYNQSGIPGPRTILAAVLAAAFATTPALADTPAAGSDVAFGARPGNVIGTGSSLPISDQASNITEANTHARIAPRLPPPRANSDSPRDLLRAAVRALDAGRTGEAQEALERAETRLVETSLPPGLPHADAGVGNGGRARQYAEAGGGDGGRGPRPA